MANKKSPLTYTDNFWSNLRVDRGYRVKELADLCEVETKTMSAFFTGQCMPPDSVIETLCEFFAVDFTKGKEEFQRAERAYRPLHKRTLVRSAKRDKILVSSKDEPSSIDMRKKVIEKCDSVMEDISEVKVFTLPQVIELLENRKELVL